MARQVEKTDKLTQSAEDYIKAIYALDERGAGVTTTALANHLGVTPPSVSAMLARLRSMGLISHQPDVRLTDNGLRLALQVVRRRRLIELFLIDSLGYSWDEVESEASLLGRAASELFVERIAAKLDHPIVDPHGDPIPSEDGRISVAPNHVLATLEPGATGRLVRHRNGDPEVLRYLDSSNIQLGDRIEVLRREPFGGPLVVRIGEPKDGRIHGFGHGLAEVLSIELDR
jgi:DtxR family Mn-dependent transcriptional regulator